MNCDCCHRPLRGEYWYHFRLNANVCGQKFCMRNLRGEDVTGHAMQLKVAPSKPKLPGPRSRLLWIGVDLDGTLAEHIWTPENPTSDIGDPILENVAKLEELVAHGYKIVIHTSRGWTDYEAIETWLRFHRIPYREIQCGKPLYALYIDDRGRHADTESWLP